MPENQKGLNRHIDAANTCIADPAGMGIFEVDDRGVQFSVDINLKKCSCRRWDLTGIPCCHGVSACRYEKIAPESMVHKCYSIETYGKAYEHVIMPCKDVSEWQSMYGKEIIPPKVKTKKGKQKNRRKQPEEKEGRAGRKVGRGGAVIHCSYCGGAAHNIGGCKDFKLGLKPKKRGQKNRVRAEPEISSDEEPPVITQEQNLQTMELAHHDPLYYEDTVISLLMEEHQASQNMEQHEPGPLPGSSFIADHVQSEPPVQPTTITKEGNVIRKREVVALAKLKAAAEKREIADQAKFDAAMAKLRSEELKILQAGQKRKEESAAKKLEKEEKQKALLQQKQLVAEEKRKAAEERKKKAQQEKEAKKNLEDAKKQAKQARKKQAEEEKNKRVAERKRIAEQKRRHIEDAHRYEEAEFLIMQEDEHERQQGMREYLRRDEQARQQAWEGQVELQRSSKMQDWEEKRKEAEEMNMLQAEQAKVQAVNEKVDAMQEIRVRSEKEREGGNESSMSQQKNAKRGNSSQSMRGFKMPRRTSMFDVFRD